MGGERRDTIKGDMPTVATRVEGEIPGRQMSASICLVSEIYIRSNLLARPNLIPQVGKVFMAVFMPGTVGY